MSSKTDCMGIGAFMLIVGIVIVGVAMFTTFFEPHGAGQMARWSADALTAKSAGCMVFIVGACVLFIGAIMSEPKKAASMAVPEVPREYQ